MSQQPKHMEPSTNSYAPAYGYDGFGGRAQESQGASRRCSLTELSSSPGITDFSANAAASPENTFENGTFTFDSYPNKTYTDNGFYLGGDLGASFGSFVIFGPKDLKPEDLNGFSVTYGAGYSFEEAGFQTSANQDGFPTLKYIITFGGLSASLPGGGMILSNTKVTDYHEKPISNIERWHIRTYCFSDDTKVLMSDNNLKEVQNIEIIQSLATKTYKFSSDNIYKLIVRNEEILVTGHHPFYDEKKGWVEVENLIVGDKLLLFNNKLMVLNSKEKLFWNKFVYNIDVDRYHNYFISKRKIFVYNK